MKANDRIKARAATLSLATNTVLVAIKLVAALLTGSVALLTEAFHSGTDVLASGLALASVRAASAPPDEEHPYGHAKIESVAALAEAMMLGVLCLFVVGQGLYRLWVGARVQKVDFGIVMAAASAVLSFAASRYVSGTAKTTGSTILRSNALHLSSDALITAGVMASLVVIRLTGWPWVDGLVGIGIGLWLLQNAAKIGDAAFQELIDRRLPDDEQERVRELIESERAIVSYHRLRTRVSGQIRYIDFHIVVPNDWSVVQAHGAADQLERKILAALEHAVVVVHVDPYDESKVRPRTP